MPAAMPAFVTGPFPGNLEWLPRRLLAFFDDILQR